MDSNQQYYLDKYTKDLNLAYNNLHDSRVDYDTFKPISESSNDKTINAKKVFDNLAPNYIYYPDFLKNLQLLYLNSKAQSDADKDILKQKSDALAVFQKNYNDIVEKINALEIQIYEEELAADIQNLVNIPENMVQSDELIIAKAAADKVATDKAASDKVIADAAKALAAKNAPKVTITETGAEVCLDSMGNQIDMSICRPNTGGSTPSTPSAPSAPHIDTAAELVAKNINSWLQQYQPKANTPASTSSSTPASTPISTSSVDKVLTPEEQSAKDAKDAADKATADKAAIDKATSDKETADKAAADKIANFTPEEYINSFVFNVDLSKLNTEKATATTTETPTSSDINNSDITNVDSKISDIQNKLNNSNLTKDQILLLQKQLAAAQALKAALIELAAAQAKNSSKEEIAALQSKLSDAQTAQLDAENEVVNTEISNTPISNTPIVTSINNNSKLFFGAAVLSFIVAYNLIKKED